MDSSGVRLALDDSEDQVALLIAAASLLRQLAVIVVRPFQEAPPPRDPVEVALATELPRDARCWWASLNHAQELCLRRKLTVFPAVLIYARGELVGRLEGDSVTPSAVVELAKSVKDRVNTVFQSPGRRLAEEVTGSPSSATPGGAAGAAPGGAAGEAAPAAGTDASSDASSGGAAGSVEPLPAAAEGAAPADAWKSRREEYFAKLLARQAAATAATARSSASESGAGGASAATPRTPESKRPRHAEPARSSEGGGAVDKAAHAAAGGAAPAAAPAASAPAHPLAPSRSVLDAAAALDPDAAPVVFLRHLRQLEAAGVSRAVAALALVDRLRRPGDAGAPPAGGGGGAGALPAAPAPSPALVAAGGAPADERILARALDRLQASGAATGVFRLTAEERALGEALVARAEARAAGDAAVGDVAGPLDEATQASLRDTARLVRRAPLPAAPDALPAAAVRPLSRDAVAPAVHALLAYGEACGAPDWVDSPIMVRRALSAVLADPTRRKLKWGAGSKPYGFVSKGEGMERLMLALGYVVSTDADGSQVLELPEGADMELLRAAVAALPLYG